jgi:hypothetical protein
MSINRNLSDLANKAAANTRSIIRFVSFTFLLLLSVAIVVGYRAWTYKQPFPGSSGRLSTPGPNSQNVVYIVVTATPTFTPTPTSTPVPVPICPSCAPCPPVECPTCTPCPPCPTRAPCPTQVPCPTVTPCPPCPPCPTPTPLPSGYVCISGEGLKEVWVGDRGLTLPACFSVGFGETVIRILK